MEHDTAKEILDKFTFRQFKRKLLSKKELIFKFGERINDENGFRYIWPKPVRIRIAKSFGPNASRVIYSGQIASLKLWKDRISFSIPNSIMPRNLPDEVNELIDRTQSDTTLSSFDILELYRA